MYLPFGMQQNHIKVLIQERFYIYLPTPNDVRFWSENDLWGNKVI